MSQYFDCHLSRFAPPDKDWRLECMRFCDLKGLSLGVFSTAKNMSSAYGAEIAGAVRLPE
jgi:hypothetical protein